MKTFFAQPRFNGQRFEEHTLPIDVLSDLAEYETLVVELAKRLYLQDHPDRQRVPKGFASNFHLHLVQVDEGSAKPLLSLITAAALALGAEDSYFQQARDLITECIAAPTDRLPERFPRDLLPHFNQLGSSLLPGEQIEFSRPSGTNAVLTQDKRKALVLAVDKVYVKSIMFTGFVEEVDWKKSSFRLRINEGGQAIVPVTEDVLNEASKYGGHQRHQISIKGTGAYDAWDKLQKIISVTNFDVQLDYQLASRFDELKELKAGWYDGAGEALNSANLDLISSKIIGHYPEKLPLPAIVPTPEGNLLFEWNIPDSEPSVDINLGDLSASFHAFAPTGEDIEKDFDLSGSAWDQFFEFLNRNIETV